MCKLSTDPNGLTSSNINGDRLYESVTDHALAEGPLTFPMMGWPYYVRNPQQDLGFNDLLTKKVATYPLQNIADISFVGLNYPTKSELWHKNRAKFALQKFNKQQMKLNSIYLVVLIIKVLCQLTLKQQVIHLHIVQ